MEAIRIILAGLAAYIGVIFNLFLSSVVPFTAYFIFPGTSQAEIIEPAPLVVSTRFGKISGRFEKGIRVFKGIPYARPPIGDLRWRAAQAPLPWRGILDAKSFGAACLQTKRSGRSIPVMSEDCLTLNIWAPKQTTNHAPVMVWLHGGAFQFGTASLPVYNGSAFAKSGVILISLNYRLGRFGFFAHPVLRADAGADADLANFALSDQIQALRWIKQNISAFGGDPNNLTLFGESAGAVSIAYLLGSNQAKGLFNKAIMQSGGGYQIARYAWCDRGRKLALSKDGLAWARRHNLVGSISAIDLRRVPAEEVLEKDRPLGPIGHVNPVIDGRLVKADIIPRFNKGGYPAVPIMVGSNSYEASLMQSFKRSPQIILSRLRQHQNEARSLYKTSSLNDRQFAYELFGDAAFLAPARAIAKIAKNAGQESWVYYFDYRHQPSNQIIDGSQHGLEIPFVFKTIRKMLDNFSFDRENINSQRLSGLMHTYWVNFAKYGSPAVDDMPEWSPYQHNNDGITLVLQNKGGHMVAGFRQDKLDFHDRLYAERLKGAQKLPFHLMAVHGHGEKLKIEEPPNNTTKRRRHAKACNG
ncbi:MAG: carboxylesterase family protein [Robiginitomaculum sp.]|nr:carboxylesterase family protein [Robiginitomaculum sp.]